MNKRIRHIKFGKIGNYVLRGAICEMEIQFYQTN
jgi:hypothetical protein